MRILLFFLLCSVMAVSAQAQTGNNREMFAGEFQSAGSLLAVFPSDFDFNVRCQILSYQVTRVPKRDDPIVAINNGSGFSIQATSLMQSVKPGDIVYFDEIKCQCPFDPAARILAPLVIRVK